MANAKQAATKWDGKYNAPAGKFRVIAEDTFPWPHEPYFIGDFDTYDKAKKACDKADKKMNPAEVYDEEGEIS